MSSTSYHLDYLHFTPLIPLTSNRDNKIRRQRLRFVRFPNYHPPLLYAILSGGSRITEIPTSPIQHHAKLRSFRRIAGICSGENIHGSIDDECGLGAT